jgi:dipeptidase D
MERKEISKAVLKRLPGYVAYLKSTQDTQSPYISATALANALGMGEVQVRKDLAMVSDGGRPKIGYLRESLIEDIEQFLGYDNTTDAVLIGAGKLEFSRLSGRRLINIDSEEEDTLTVSCAGGCDLILHLPIQREKTVGKKIAVKLSGLKGGHSGIEIGNGRVNADVLMGRVLAKLSEKIEISLLSVSGGDKGNAIPLSASFEGVVSDADAFVKNCSAYLSEVKKELSQREPDFDYEVKAYSEGEFEAVGAKDSKRFFDALCTVPNGVIEMSPSIPNLVETSLNLGILKSEENAVVFQLMLRSNLYSALLGLEERVKAFARLIGATTTSFGHYPPWEYRPDSPLRDLYGKIYREEIGKDIRIEAIHAGLECGVISAGLPGIDCISIGPDLWDVHTTKERMSISSVNRVYQRIIKTLAKLG